MGIGNSRLNEAYRPFLSLFWALPLNMSPYTHKEFCVLGEGQVEHHSESEFKNAGRSFGPKALWAGQQRSWMSASLTP